MRTGGSEGAATIESVNFLTYSATLELSQSIMIFENGCSESEANTADIVQFIVRRALDLVKRDNKNQYGD